MRRKLKHRPKRIEKDNNTTRVDIEPTYVPSSAPTSLAPTSLAPTPLPSTAPRLDHVPREVHRPLRLDFVAILAAVTALICAAVMLILLSRSAWRRACRKKKSEPKYIQLSTREVDTKEDLEEDQSTSNFRPVDDSGGAFEDWLNDDDDDDDGLGEEYGG